MRQENNKVASFFVIHDIYQPKKWLFTNSKITATNEKIKNSI